LNSKNKKLGIFVCTRKRIDSLELLIESVFSSCSNKDNIDLWIGFDEDDHKTSMFLSCHQEKDRINTYVNSNKGSNCVLCEKDYVNRHKDIIQPMVDRSDAEYLWVLNDDLTIKTNNFDLIIEQCVENFLSDKVDRVFYGMPLVHFIDQKGLAKDTFSLDHDNKLFFKTEYSCYPLITRETEKILGHFLNTKFASGGADIVLGAGIGLSNYCRKEEMPVVLEDKLVDTFKRVRPYEVLPSEFIRDNGGMSYEVLPQTIVEAYVDVLKNNNLSCDHYDTSTPSPQLEIMNTVATLNKKMKEDQVIDTISPVGLDILLLFKCSNCKTLYRSPSSHRMDHSCCTHCGKISYIKANRGGHEYMLDLTNRIRQAVPEVKKGV
tara:strand:+ start:1943 stop:3073 length:1131 start_codon:yes stop_codon:yes gene_type:complete